MSIELQLRIHITRPIVGLIARIPKHLSGGRRYAYLRGFETIPPPLFQWVFNLNNFVGVLLHHIWILLFKVIFFACYKNFRVRHRYKKDPWKPGNYRYFDWGLFFYFPEQLLKNACLMYTRQVLRSSNRVNPSWHGSDKFKTQWHLHLRPTSSPILPRADRKIKPTQIFLTTNP